MSLTNLLTTNGQSFIFPSSLSQSSGTISATVAGLSLSIAVPSLTAGSTYYIYLLNGALQVSTTVSSTFRGSNPGAYLIGAFLADSSAAFGSFVNIDGKPCTQSAIVFTGTSGGGLGTLVSPNFNVWRDGKYLVCDYRFTTGTVNGSVAAQIPLPTNLTIDTGVFSQTSYYLGTCLNNSAVAFTQLVALPGTSTSALFFNSSSTFSNTGINGVSPFASGQLESGQYRVPISQWGNGPLKDL